MFSPDGKALLTSSVEGFARLFDVEAGGCLVTFGRKATGGSLAVDGPFLKIHDLETIGAIMPSHAASSKANFLRYLKHSNVNGMTFDA